MTLNERKSLIWRTLPHYSEAPFAQGVSEDFLAAVYDESAEYPPLPARCGGCGVDSAKDK
jgi:hypothetical protein